MNEERTGKCLRQVEHIYDHLDIVCVYVKIKMKINKSLI
jgi:hypothetical protein